MFYTHTALNFIVEETTNQHSKWGILHFTPSGKEGKKMDVLGRKTFSSAILRMRIVNYQALTA